MENTAHLQDHYEEKNPSRKDRFVNLVKEINMVKETLLSASSEEVFIETLNNLDSTIEALSKEPQMGDLRGLILDIAGVIRGVRLHDITRRKLVALLNKLIQRANIVIAEEAKKEKAQKMKALFLVLAEHSDEISDFIDINQFFG